MNKIILLIVLMLAGCLNDPASPSPKKINPDSLNKKTFERKNPFKKDKDSSEKKNEFLFKWTKGAQNTIYETVLNSNSSNSFSPMTVKFVSSRMQESKIIMGQVDSVIEKVSIYYETPFKELGYKVEIKDSDQINLSDFFHHTVIEGKDTLVLKKGMEDEFVSRAGEELQKEDTKKLATRDSVPAAESESRNAR